MCRRNRSKWEYWYGPYSEWAFFVHLTALLFLLIVICCPEWAYQKTNVIYVFREIGLFKQCFLSSIFKKSGTSVGLCTLSDSRTNQCRCFFFVCLDEAFSSAGYFFLNSMGQCNTSIYVNGFYIRINFLDFNDCFSKGIST